MYFIYLLIMIFYLIGCIELNRDLLIFDNLFIKIELFILDYVVSILFFIN